jgi:hypothetical protein
MSYRDGTAIRWAEVGMERNERVEGIMGHGCSVCEGQRTLTGDKSLAPGNAIAS